MAGLNHTHRPRPCCPQPDGAPAADGDCLEDYQTAVDDGVFATSSSTPAATGKVLTTPIGFSGGRYQLQFSYVIDGDEFDDFFVQIGLDGAPPANAVWPQDHREEVVDDDDGERDVYAQAICLDVSAGVHTFEIYLWTEPSGNAHEIRETTIEIWKVAT